MRQFLFSNGLIMSVRLYRKSHGREEGRKVLRLAFSSLQYHCNIVIKLQKCIFLGFIIFGKYYT
jgi:hypothetical protein